MFAGYGRQKGWERDVSGNELPGNEDGFVELVRFIVVREFSGEKSMREAFEQLIERQTCEHFEEWRHQREMAEKAA